MYYNVRTQMRLIWDEYRNRYNLLKHKVSFETAALVFNDPQAVSVQDRLVQGEDRWQTLGLIAGAVVLLVAHSIEFEGDEEIVCIIATPREREIYAQSQQKRK